MPNVPKDYITVLALNLQDGIRGYTSEAVKVCRRVLLALLHDVDGASLVVRADVFLVKEN